MAKTEYTEESRWTSAEYNLSVARLAWSAVKGDMDCSARQQVALALDDAKNILYSVPAPDISGVRQKLAVWWGESLFEDSYASSVNCKVIGDLTRIELQLLGVEEAEASGRTPEEAAEQADAWQAAHREYHDHARLLTEGRSPSRDQREADAIVDVMFQATDALLDLPAPSIHGVIQKLELIWEMDRLETVVDGTIYVNVMRDLHGLSNPTYRPGDDLH